jgi:DNA-binding beta-propeller fold protein YncE
MNSLFLAAILAIAITALPAPANEGPVPQLLLSWGTTGSGVGEFNRPEGIVVDDEGNVFVADKDNYRIQKFTPAGEFITQWGSQGTTDGEFSQIWDIATDQHGNVYVSEQTSIGHLIRYRVQKFNGDGVFLASWPIEAKGLYVDGLGKLYAVPHIEPAVKIYGPDGVYEREIEFIHNNRDPPRDVVVDDMSGCVYVAKGGSVSKYSLDGTRITFWHLSNQFPYGYNNGDVDLALDKEGNIYATCYASNLVVKHSPEGSEVFRLASWGESQHFDNPDGVAVTNLGEMLVVDHADRVVKFGYVTAVEPTTWGRIKAKY